ncbi:hypothetical protein WHI96_26585 [Pseudonocardia tropica]|uniref:Uncharacterized protein n=1 Tax=Pseudonocardia tropica TaxID=681289 RepID=A0ABV1K2B1_9PSEU
MSTDLDHLKQLVAQYAQARAELIEHPSYEAGCAPDRLLHRRDDVAIEVADAVVAQQLPQIAGELDVDTAVAAAVAWFRDVPERMRDLDDVDNRSAAITILRQVL